MEIRLDFEAKENTIYEFKKVLLPEEEIDILEVKTFKYVPEASTTALQV